MSDSYFQPELARLGVARVTFSSGLMGAVLGYLRVIADELLTHGTYTKMSENLIAGNEFRRLFYR